MSLIALGFSETASKRSCASLSEIAVIVAVQCGFWFISEFLYQSSKVSLNKLGTFCWKVGSSVFFGISSNDNKCFISGGKCSCGAIDQADEWESLKNKQQQICITLVLLNSIIDWMLKKWWSQNCLQISCLSYIIFNVKT